MVQAAYIVDALRTPTGKRAGTLANTHPADMGAPEVEAFLSALATELDVSASTQNQAKHAVLFLYKQVLGVTLPWLDGITSAKINKRLPVVLTVTASMSFWSSILRQSR